MNISVQYALISNSGKKKEITYNAQVKKEQERINRLKADNM